MNTMHTSSRLTTDHKGTWYLVRHTATGAPSLNIAEPDLVHFIVRKEAYRFGFLSPFSVLCDEYEYHRTRYRLVQQ